MKRMNYPEALNFSFFLCAEFEEKCLLSSHHDPKAYREWQIDCRVD